LTQGVLRTVARCSKAGTSDDFWVLDRARYGFEGSQAFVASLADRKSLGIPLKRVLAVIDLERSSVSWEVPVLVWMDDSRIYLAIRCTDLIIYFWFFVHGDFNYWHLGWWVEMLTPNER